jgi:transposase
MGEIERRKLSKEFKLEAVRMCEGRPVEEVARSLGVHGNSIYRWRQELKQEGPEAFRGNGNRTTLEEENRQLRHRVQQLEMETEILKKASAYFAKNLR